MPVEIRDSSSTTRVVSLAASNQVRWGRWKNDQLVYVNCFGMNDPFLGAWYQRPKQARQPFPWETVELKRGGEQHGAGQNSPKRWRMGDNARIEGAPGPLWVATDRYLRGRVIP
jgi:hypothetical protein